MADWVDLETAIQTAEEPEMHEDDRGNMSEFYENMFKNGGEYNPVPPFSDEALDTLFADLNKQDEQEIVGQGELSDIGDDDISL